MLMSLTPELKKRCSFNSEHGDPEETGSDSITPVFKARLQGGTSLHVLHLVVQTWELSFLNRVRFADIQPIVRADNQSVLFDLKNLSELSGIQTINCKHNPVFLFQTMSLAVYRKPIDVLLILVK